MSFKNAAQNTATIARTENGMKAFGSSLNANVDLFFSIGASRGKDVIPSFERAYQEDRQLALRVAAWARDVRGGTGERKVWRDILAHVEKLHSKDLAKLVEVTPEFGRWDDLLVLQSGQGRVLAFDLIGKALEAKNALCAKWMPRKGADAVALRKHLGMSPKQYRKTLVELTKVVETQMCANQWSAINYNHVPSVAAARYQKAFGKHDPVGYNAYKTGLASGESKINAGAVYPYDVVKSHRFGGDDVVIQAQWDALPNYIGDALVLPMCDVSGSMNCAVGGNANLTCMDVCVSLGLYLADKNTGPFKDMFLTFSGNSKIEVLRGNLIAKLAQLENADWDMNTNLHAAFDAILKVATEHKVAKDEMPQYLLIMSDMQFDNCATHDDSAIEMIQRKYAAAGYDLPKIVFWSLNARSTSVPVTYNQKGVALVSGFSPAIMQSILKAEEIDPVSIMLATVNAPRYQVIV